MGPRYLGISFAHPTCAPSAGRYSYFPPAPATCPLTCHFLLRIHLPTSPAPRIGDVIGQGGKTIRSIIERFGSEEVIRISIEKDGRVSFSSTDDAMIRKAVGFVEGLTLELGVGTKFEGRVTKILPFGAYIEVAEGKEGWLHISELEYKCTASVDDMCKVGDELEVKVIELGRNGQFRVIRKACMPSERNGREDSDINRRKVGSGEGQRGNGNANK